VPARILTVRADASDNRGQMDHQIGPRVVIEPADGFDPDQIVIGLARDKNIFAAARAQFPDHVRAKKARAAGDDDPFVRECFCHSDECQAFADSPSPFTPNCFFLSAARSASTIILTSSWNFTFGSQPSFRRAFDASPISRSTSAGR